MGASPESACGRRRGVGTDDGGPAMTETQILLGKIAALRQRLEQAQGLARDASTAAAALAGETVGRLVSLHHLEHQTVQAAEHDAALDRAVRPLVAAAGGDAPPMPKQLTARARR